MNGFFEFGLGMLLLSIAVMILLIVTAHVYEYGEDRGWWGSKQ